MRRMLLAGAALLAGCAGAAAQVVIETPPAYVYGAPPAYTYEVYGYRAGPRVYYEAPRYYYRDSDDDDDVVIVRPRYRSGCGAYHYWNGSRCIYIRH